MSQQHLRARPYKHIGELSSSPLLYCTLTIWFSQWAATGVDTSKLLGYTNEIYFSILIELLHFYTITLIIVI